MKPKTMILMAVAVTCGLGASYMTSRLLAERSSAPAEPDTLKVLVAAKNLDMGVALKNVDELFQLKDFLKGTEPKDGIAKAEDLKGRVLKRSLRAGDPIRQDDLLDFGQGGLAVTLPAGYRAMGIQVNMASIAGGFASLPHSRVDIICTVRRGSDKDSFTKVLLENVLVLAADQQLHRDETGRAMPANVVTVAVKPEDSLKLSMASEMGPLKLVLRKFNDNTKSGDLKYTVENLLANQSVGAQAVDDSNETLPTPIAKVEKVDLPKLPTGETAPLPKIEPDGTQHTIRVFEGDRERHVHYLLNDKGDVISKAGAVERGDLPRPPQPQVDAPPVPRPETPAVPPTGNPEKY